MTKKVISKILERNSRVEADKAWETSKTRKLVIALITYIFAVIFLYYIGAKNPFLNAFIPVGGFLISTLTMSFLKKIWIKKVYKN